MVASVALILLGACSPGSGDYPTPTSGFLNLDGTAKAVFILTVHFHESATKADMADAVERLDTAVSQAPLDELPSMGTPLYEEHKIVLGWPSIEIGRRGEARVRAALVGSSIVDRIEASTPPRPTNS